jgi:hypothetical protein
MTPYVSPKLISILMNIYTRWFKYDRDYLCVNKSQFVPVIFEPPCIYIYIYLKAKISCILKTEGAKSSEIPLSISKSTRHSMPEDFNIYQHRYDNVKSRTINDVSIGGCNASCNILVLNYVRQLDTQRDSWLLEDI